MRRIRTALIVELPVQQTDDEEEYEKLIEVFLRDPSAPQKPGFRLYRPTIEQLKAFIDLNGLWVPFPHEPVRHECANCAARFTDNMLERADKLGVGAIKDLHERLDPAGEVPSGECPRCGALTYLTDAAKLEKEEDEK